MSGVQQDMNPESRKLPAAISLFHFVDRKGRALSHARAAESAFRLKIQGEALLSEQEIGRRVSFLKSLSSNDYHREVIAPLESGERWSVIKLVHELASQIHQEVRQGPLYLAEVELCDDRQSVRFGIIAQNRLENKGVWMPAHHRAAAQWARDMERRRLPILTLIDTPGADAGAAANEQNQAHSISALIATMADLTVPTIGLVWGVGYSGGAIPLATTNALLSVRDGLFSTIQPQGLAAIARKQKLDWKTCAQLVGVSACELQQEQVIDAVIDYSPVDGPRTAQRLADAVLAALAEVERQARKLVAGTQALGEFYLHDSRVCASQAEDEELRGLTPRDPQQQPSLFGVAFRTLRSLALRARLKTLSGDEEPEWRDPEFKPARQVAVSTQAQAARFKEWQERKDKLVYEESIYRCWIRFREAKQQLGTERSYIATLLLGNPQDNYEKAVNELCTEIAFSLYNLWQRDVRYNLDALSDYLRDKTSSWDSVSLANDQITLMDILADDRFTPLMLEHCRQLKQFDLVYEKILAHLTRFVSELSERKRLSAEFMNALLDDAGMTRGEVRDSFARWLMAVRSTSSFRDFLRTAEQWKKQQHPSQSTVAFVVASYLFEKLLPEYFATEKDGKSFSGRFQPVSIGRRKDFWNQLKQATIDLRIQEVLNQVKPARIFAPERLVETFFSDFRELDADLTSADPRRFPGFTDTLRQQREQGEPTAGLMTGIAQFRGEGQSHAVGLFVSNHQFQAGAFDMAAGERFCRLLAYCAEHGLPVVGFVCSGGMQTKEGASALFSMAVVNDHINRFVMEARLPILMIGYGDCTGGAQASLVTHPLVDTYYFSGTNMPFAGRIVVPDYLPVTSTLSNYLVRKPGSMRGLVKHPFVEDLDQRLRAIDPGIPTTTLDLNSLLSQWLQNKGGALAEIALEQEQELEGEVIPQKFAMFDTLLVHARGCTAVKLIREAQAMDLNVVLVQSDPDMNSVAADMLGENDQLVCLGGYTSEESYLNGASVLRIAELSGAQALHPGIGFLSENPQFARECLRHGLVFVGPSPESMASMGDKAQAIRTAMAANVPVVPGSHGVLRDVEHARAEAERIGYPVILKAAHGGGGKGIVEVHEPGQLEELFMRIQTEGRNAFGRDEVYLERLITRFRHIEVQVLRDRFGCTQILGLRDCSVQRNKQKILEESGSTLLTPEMAKVARESAARLAEACGYVGAGTIEYIYDLDRQQLYFMEMNTRLQVEHPVTEKVSGVDIVREQLRIAMGKSIDHLPQREQGYAIEVRINAEQVAVDSQGRLQVIPNPGLVTHCDFPEREGITGIVSVGSGKAIPPFYDNLIAQIIAYGETRDDAIRMLRDYLREVKVEGVQTNIPLLIAILEDEVFISGDFDTSYLKGLAERRGDSFGRLSQDEGTASPIQAIQIEGSDELKVLAPSSSILYRAPSPSQPPYVREGDLVSVDQTLCLLEVMKMFQPLSLASFNRNGRELYPAGQKYIITHIKGADGQHVNQGDLLFVVRPVTDLSMTA